MNYIRPLACALLLLPFSGSAQIVFESELSKPGKSIKAKEYYEAGKDAYKQYKDIEAIASFRAAIAEDSDYIDAYNALGLIYQHRRGKRDSVLYCFLESHRRYPEGAISLRYLGGVYSARYEIAKAVEYYKEAVALDPDNPAGCHGLAMSYYNLGKTIEALEYAHKAEKYYKQTNSPYLGECYRSLYVIYVKAKNKKKARKYRRLAEAAGKFLPEVQE